jgi:hypothetical protein
VLNELITDPLKLSIVGNDPVSPVLEKNSLELTKSPFSYMFVYHDIESKHAPLSRFVVKQFVVAVYKLLYDIPLKSNVSSF